MTPEDLSRIALDAHESLNDAFLDKDRLRRRLMLLFHECKKMTRPLDADVADFQLQLGFPVRSSETLPPETEMEFRMRLIREEYEELEEAMYSRDLARIAQEGVDLVYVIMGTFVTLGLSFMPFWKLIHQANMKKRPCPNGGKALKPEGWKKPDCSELIDLDPIDLDYPTTQRRKPR